MVGRTRDLAGLRGTLGTARVVTLTGPVGIGKTTLARAATADHARVRREDTWIVELADLVDPELLAAAVADAVGVRPRGDGSAHEIGTALGDRGGLLVLDGCEAAHDAVVPLVPALLRAAPRLRVLTTSRRPLGVTGEVVVPVGPLSDDEARALFVTRAAAALPSFRLTDDNSPAVAELCAALEGVPLAIELAAARISVLSPQGVLDRLGGRPADRQRLLAKGAPTAPARQRSLRASLEASSELCTPDERRLWARLSVFTGGFALEAAEAVCAGDGVDEADVLDLVDGLLEKSVLVRDDDGATYVRFRMPEPLREYGAEALSPEQQRAVRARHLAWFAELVRAFADASFGPQQAPWYDVLRREHANLREALGHALSDFRHGPEAVDVATALAPYWITTGRLDEARHWLTLAAAVPHSDPGTRARVLAVSAWVAVVQGDLEEARSLLDEAEPLLAGAHTGDAVRAHVQTARALESLLGRDPLEALPVAERSATVARAVGDRSLEATALLLLGLGRARAGRLDSAGAALQECVDLTEQAGETQVRSLASAGLAASALLRGDLDAAAEIAAHALAMATRLGGDLAAALALEVLGRVAALERRPDRAATLLGAADARWRRRGLDPSGTPLVSGYRESLDEVSRLDRPDARQRAAFTSGAALTDDQVLSHALEQAPAQDAPLDVDDLDALTRRELEVARLVGAGLSNREIADRLGRSQRTVETHVEHVLRKLGFGSRTQVAAWIADREGRQR